MSLKIEELSDLFVQNGLDQATRSKLIKAAEALEQEKKEDRASGSSPKSKNKYTVIVRGDENLSKILAQAWIVKTKEDLDENLIVDRLKLAVKRNNEAARKQKNVIKVWCDVFTFLKRKLSKVEDVAVQTVTKQPVRVIVLKDENAV